ncbi:hypothetical protein AAMO2058_000291000 [Amorphochlora amoebiformis]
MRTLFLRVLGASMATFSSCRYAFSEKIERSHESQKKMANISADYVVYRCVEGGRDRQLVPASMEEMMDHFKRNTTRLIIMGEHHNDVVGHEIERLVYESLGNATLSLEMFCTDKQMIMNEYLNNLIPESAMEQECDIWPNYHTDYRPLVRYAKNRGLPVICANTPKRYITLNSSTIHKLSDRARKEFLPPIVYPASDDYSTKFVGIMRLMKSGEDMKTILKRMYPQLLWDATMGWKLVEALDDAKTPKILHICGSFHMANWLGIPEQMDQFLREYKHCEDVDSGQAFRNLGVTALIMPVEHNVIQDIMRNPRALDEKEVRSLEFGLEGGGPWADWVIFTDIKRTEDAYASMAALLRPKSSASDTSSRY